MKIRWTAGAALITGLCLGACSAFIEHVSLGRADNTFFVYYTGVGAKLFALATLFIAVYVIERERAKALSRLQKLEGELTEMRSKLIHLRAFNV